MHRKLGTATVIIAVLGAVLAWTPGAHAQDVEVKVKIPGDVIREVNRIVDAVTGPEAQQEIRDAIRDLTGSLSAINGPEIHDVIHDAIRDAVRDATRGLAHARDMGWLDEQNRNFTARQTDHETKTFQLGANGQLTLDNVVGDITITAGSRRDVVVEIIRESRGRTDADARTGLDRVRVETTAQGGRATVRANYQNETRANYSVEVRYTVTAPAGTQISAHSTTGNVSVTGIHGDVSVASISGDVSVTDASRVSEIRTMSGNVTLKSVNSDGTINASSTSGSITATQIRARRVDFGSISDNIIARDIVCDNGEFHTITGETEFSGPLAPRGRYQFTTHSGNVRVITDGKVGFALESNSFSGTTKSDFPIQTATGRLPRRSLSGTFGDGSAQIVATTFSGNVTLIRR